jgi:hypothetical protein
LGCVLLRWTFKENEWVVCLKLEACLKPSVRKYVYAIVEMLG